ncbi:MAG: hypothetical protein ACI906_005018 [Candidatus Latescibacterota bacterium]
MKLVYLLFISCMSTTFIACGLQQSTAPKSEAVVPFVDLDVPADFNWSASQRAQLDVEVRAANGTIDSQGQLLILQDGSGHPIARAIINSGRAQFNVLLPAGLNEARLYFPLTHNIFPINNLQNKKRILMPVAYALFGADNGLLYAFAGSATPRAGKLAQSTNDALVNGDFDDNSLSLIAADDIYSTTSYTGSWFGVEMSRNGWNPSLAGKRLMMGHPNMAEASYVLQDVPAAAGDVLTFSIAVRQPAGNDEGTLRAYITLLATHPNDNDQYVSMLNYTEITDENGQQYKDWTDVTLTATLPANASAFRIVIAVREGSKQTHFDQASATGINREDADGDGIYDPQDDYPDDPTVAVRNSVPSSGYAHIAFEDMWPPQGDYDFNDLVIAHKTDFAYSASGALIRADVEVQVRALGALYHNGLALRFTQLDGNNSTYSLINNTIIEAVSGDVDPDGTPQVLRFTVDFDQQNIAAYTEGLVGEFFIYRSDQRNHEIHLPGFPPSSAADMQLFGIEDDGSTENNWYKTASGLPWSIEIVNGQSYFAHPVEFISIETAYPEFTSWAQSGGTINQTWYNAPSMEVPRRGRTLRRRQDPAYSHPGMADLSGGNGQVDDQDAGA